MCELMCAVALERLGDERAADALLQALADPDWRVLSAAGTGLVRLGDRRAIPPLLRLLDHADRSVRYGVCRDLLNLKAGDQRLVDALERLSQDPEAEEHDLEADEWNCEDRKSTRLNSSHVRISYAVFCLKKKKKKLVCSVMCLYRMARR